MGKSEGEIGYKYKSDIYRPSKKITKKAPLTHGKLQIRSYQELEMKNIRKEELIDSENKIRRVVNGQENIKDPLIAENRKDFRKNNTVNIVENVKYQNYVQ